MNEQDGKGAQKTALQRPAMNDKEAWRAHWEQRGQPWRWEPEINAERQKYLAECRDIKPDIDQGIYPFRGIKLSRADVEWLLATHQNGDGPVDWSDESQCKREGLDLRGALLSGIDLSFLPLARTIEGIHSEYWLFTTETSCLTIVWATIQDIRLHPHHASVKLQNASLW